MTLVDNWTAAKELKLAQVARKLHMSSSLTDRFLKKAVCYVQLRTLQRCGVGLPTGTSNNNNNNIYIYQKRKIR